MSKAEKFIDDYTRTCSNELEGGIYHEWLTTNDALSAVEIAREEIYEWLQKCLPSYILYCNDGVLKGTTQFINVLKQAMRDE